MKPVSQENRDALKDLSADGEWVWLLEAELDESTLAVPTILLNSGDRPLDFEIDSVNYTFSPYPFKVGRWSENSQGKRSPFTVTLTNVGGAAASWLRVGDGFRDRFVRVMAVYRPLAEAGHFEPAFQLEGRVDEPVVTLEAVSLPLRTQVRRKFPRELYVASCGAIYKSPGDCGYVGDLPSCAKTLTACNEHGQDEKANNRPVRHPRRYRGFPAVPRSTT